MKRMRWYIVPSPRDIYLSIYFTQWGHSIHCQGLDQYNTLSFLLYENLWLRG